MRMLIAGIVKHTAKEDWRKKARTRRGEKEDQRKKVGERRSETFLAEREGGGP